MTDAEILSWARPLADALEDGQIVDINICRRCGSSKEFRAYAGGSDGLFVDRQATLLEALRTTVRKQTHG